MNAVKTGLGSAKQFKSHCLVGDEHTLFDQSMGLQTDPVAQFEKLWSDMSGLPDVACGYLAVPRLRGQQLKDPNQLDAWANDGSKDHIASLCDFA